VLCHAGSGQNANLALKRTTTYSLSLFLSQNTKHTLGQLCARTLARRLWFKNASTFYFLCRLRRSQNINLPTEKVLTGLPSTFVSVDSQIRALGAPQHRTWNDVDDDDGNSPALRIPAAS
jgi:hypothetical protein